MIQYIRPMKARSVKAEELKQLWNDPDWVAEEKLDGSRYLLWVNSKAVHLISRRKSVDGSVIDKADNVPHITKNSIWKGLSGTVLDGEIIGPDKFGSCVSIMGSLPDKAKTFQKKNGWAIYKVFDILWYKGKNIEHIEHWKRKAILRKLLDFNLKSIEVVQEVEANKEAYYKQIVKKGGEGVILKNKYSPYIEGGNDTWVKVKKTSTYDGIVTGGQEGRGKYNNTLGALIISQYRDGKLVEVATISGMTDELRHKYWKRIKKGEQWVVEFEAQEQTKSRYRHPRFYRERTDKPEKDCLWK